MAKAFVKNLGHCLAQEFGDSIDDAKLKESFIQAIKNLPNGKLHDDLNSKFDKHFKRLERQLKDVHLTELPPLNSSVNESLDELTKSELDGRKDVADQENKQQRLLYSLFDKKIKKPRVKDMLKLNDKERIQTYLAFLKNILDKPNIPDSLVETTVKDFSENCEIVHGDVKSKFEWLPVCNVLLQLTTGSKPLAYIRVLRTLFYTATNDVNHCLATGKVVRAGKLAEIMKKFVMNSHVAISGQTLEKSETKQYYQLVSALLSLYVDLCAVHSSKIESKTHYGREVAGFVGFILRAWPDSLLELLLQLSCWEDDQKFPIVWPLLNKCLQVKPPCMDHSFYLKYVLLVRKVKDALGEFEQIENWNIQTKSIPAGKGFIDWLSDHSPEAMEHIPSEDKKFKKTVITRFLLEEAEDELLTILLDSFCTAGSTDDVDDDDDDNGDDEKTYMAAEELFYLDTGGEKSQVDQVQTEEEEEIKTDSDSKAIIVKTLEDMQQLVNESISSSQTYKLHEDLANNLTKDPDARKFFQSEIVSITPLKSVNTTEEVIEIDDDNMETTEESMTSESDGINSSKKSDNSGSDKGKKKKSSSSTPDRKKPKQGKKSGLFVEITDTVDSDISAIETNDSTFVSENTLSDDNVVLKSVVRKVSPMKVAVKVENTQDNICKNEDKNDASKSVITISDSEIVSDVASVDNSLITIDDSLFQNDDTEVVEYDVDLEDTSKTTTTNGSACLDISKQGLEDTVIFMGKSPEHSLKQKSPRKSSSNITTEKRKSVDKIEETNGQVKCLDTDSAELSELHEDMESDGDVFITSPKKNINKASNKGTTSMQEKFIVKAIQGKITKKSIGKLDRIGNELQTGSANPSPEKVDKVKDTPRTKSTEEIICIVEEIKEKIQTPQNRRASIKAKQNESMFTDDSIESLEKADSSISSENSVKPSKEQTVNEHTMSSDKVLSESQEEEIKIQDKASTPRSASKKRKVIAELRKKDAEWIEKVVETVNLVDESSSDSESVKEIPDSKIVSDSDPEPEPVGLRNKSPKLNSIQMDSKTHKPTNVEMEMPKSAQNTKNENQNSESAKKVDNMSGSRTPKSAKKTNNVKENKTPTSLKNAENTPEKRTPKSAKKTENVKENKTPTSAKNENYSQSAKKEHDKADIVISPSSARQSNNSQSGFQPSESAVNDKKRTPKSERKSANKSVIKTPGSTSKHDCVIIDEEVQQNNVGKIAPNYLSPIVQTNDEQKYNSPPPRKNSDEIDDDMIPSSHKKKSNHSNGSDNDISALPDIAIHLKQDMADGVTESPYVPRVTTEDVEDLNEDKKTPEKPKRTTRRRSVMKDIVETEINTKPTRQLRNRTVSESSADNGPSDHKKIRTASARKPQKISNALRSVPESITEEAVLKTPKAGNRPRNMSASTSKKLVNKVELMKGTRKRRLSSEFSEQDNMSNQSSDSEVSFPKIKKTQAVGTNVSAQKRNPKRLSAPPVPVAKQQPDTDTPGRRYSLRKKTKT